MTDGQSQHEQLAADQPSPSTQHRSSTKLHHHHHHHRHPVPDRTNPGRRLRLQPGSNGVVAAADDEGRWMAVGRWRGACISVDRVNARRPPEALYQ